MEGALQHVMYWSSEQGDWKNITIDQARKKFGKETIRASEHFLMCSLCHEYIIYTRDTDKRDPYFKHKPEKNERYCPERSDLSISKRDNYYQDIQKTLIYELEIKGDSFKIYLHLPKISKKLKGKYAKDTLIVLNEENKEVTSVPISKISIEDGYKVNVEDFDTPIFKFKLKDNPYAGDFYEEYPRFITGLTNGLIFDEESNKSITKNEKLSLNHGYYLFSSRDIESEPGIILGEKYVVEDFNVQKTFAYELTSITKAFYYRWWGNLTGSIKANLVPIWPTYRMNLGKYYFSTSNVIISNPSKSVVTRQYGIDEFKTKSFTFNLKVSSKSKIKLLVNEDSLLTTNVMNLRLNEKKLRIKDKVKLKLSDTANINDNYISTDGVYPLPQGKLRISNDEGKELSIEIYEGKILVDDKRLNIRNNFTLEIKVKKNQRVKIYQGMNFIKELTFDVQLRTDNMLYQQELLDKLRKSEKETPKIGLTKNVGQIYIKLREYPLCKQWLKQRIKEGKISLGSLNILRKL